jgi:long-chain fatty acid transport protein
MKTRRPRAFAASVLASCLVTTALSSTALASGFALREGDADWMANAFAGDTAKAYNASTAFANPAGMVRLNDNEITAALNYIGPTANFSGQNLVGPFPTSGTTGGNLSQDVVVPGAYGVWSYSDKLKFGFAVSSPFGERIANPGNFVGRYQSVVSSISDINISLSAAYAFDEHFSIGGGPVIDYLEARLTQAINLGQLSTVFGDPSADLHGHDTSAGFDVGLLYQVDPNLRFGLNYRSAIVHSITGTQGVFTPPLLAAAVPQVGAALQSQVSLATTKITLPDNVTLGAYWQINPQWAVMSDTSWTHWSLVDKLVISTRSPLAAGTTINENFRDTYQIAVGTSYRVLPQLLLQTGFDYDESPVRNSTRTTRIPDSDRYELAIGATYSVLPNLDVTAAYAHIFFGPAKINSSASLTAGTITGNYSTQADTFAIGATLKF